VFANESDGYAAYVRIAEYRHCHQRIFKHCIRKQNTAYRPEILECLNLVSYPCVTVTVRSRWTDEGQPNTHILTAYRIP